MPLRHFVALEAIFDNHSKQLQTTAADCDRRIHEKNGYFSINQGFPYTEWRVCCQSGVSSPRHAEEAGIRSEP